MHGPSLTTQWIQQIDTVQKAPTEDWKTVQIENKMRDNYKVV